MTTRMIMRLAGLFAVMIIYSVLSSFAFTPSSEAAEGTVTRVPKFTTVAAGDELTFEIKPTGVGGLYAVLKVIGGIRYQYQITEGFLDGIQTTHAGRFYLERQLVTSGNRRELRDPGNRAFSRFGRRREREAGQPE